MANLSSCFVGSRVGAINRAPLVLPAPLNSRAAPRQVTCMAKKKGVRCIVTLECTEARKEGGTPSRYTTQKNRRNTPGRLELMKYNRFLRRKTLHREIK